MRSCAGTSGNARAVQAVESLKKGRTRFGFLSGATASDDGQTQGFLRQILNRFKK